MVQLLSLFCQRVLFYRRMNDTLDSVAKVRTGAPKLRVPDLGSVRMLQAKGRREANDVGVCTEGLQL